MSIKATATRTLRTNESVLIVKVEFDGKRIGTVLCDSTESGWQPDADDYGTIAERLDECFAERGDFQGAEFVDLLDMVADAVWDALPE